ncbi:putative Amidase domain-containing protein [Seiridium unicorne]|uniref:Amidase domain-containing protein n=1 Tax=Seiridium unicorne TaxID=138068 RepID=A0ABR2ULJ6_9PEZI
MTFSNLFDPLVTTTPDLRRMLESKQITSVQIVEQYLEQIDRYESSLNALASIAPRDRLRRTAASLDDERREGRVRSPLHGIPIVLKVRCAAGSMQVYLGHLLTAFAYQDAFITATELGMPTCAGAAAFAGAKASKHGAIVQKLVDAGLIILAKGNMTEFAGMKSAEMMPGWSASGGQTISPYVGPITKDEKLLGHSAPGGSSSGPAVAIAAGFSPLAMGTETIGSILTPSVRAALYALKPTVGAQEVAGMYRMTDFFDVPGPMGKCAADIISLSSILLERPFDTADMGTWEGLSMASLDPSVWKMSPAMCDQFDDTEAQMINEYEAAISRIKQQGCAVRFPVDISDLSELNIDGKDCITPIAFWDFKHIGIPTFIEGFSDAPVTSLEDIVRFNENNKDLAMPEPFTKQDQLLQALKATETPEEIAQLKQKFREKGKSIINDVLNRENVNLIAAPGDSPMCIHAAAAGYPHITIPLGKLNYNGRPFGICVMAREHDEAALLRFMAAYESISEPRPIPSLVAFP